MNRIDEPGPVPSGPRRPERLALSPRMDMAGTDRLAEALQALRLADLCIDGSQAQQVGTLGLQLLVAAKLQWEADKAGFEIEAPSPGLLRAAQILGLSKVLGLTEEVLPCR